MKWLYLNQEFIKEENASLHISDLALQRGYGIFDYLKVVDGHFVFLEAHLQRLFYSAAQMRLPLKHTSDELKSIITELVERNQANTSGIRITITGGYSENGYSIAAPNMIIQQQPLRLPEQSDFEKGVRLVSYPHNRPLAPVKSTNYLMGIWLQEYIKQYGADDVLYHWDGNISECPRANIFILTEDGILVTPDKNILSGITRSFILQLGFLRCEERDISLDELYSSREVFITSTTKRIMPVVEIDGKKIHSGKAGERSLNFLVALLTAEVTDRSLTWQP